MKESIIFCQAPLKIAPALNCYKQELTSGRRVLIAVMNAINMYNFFKLLNLDADVIFLDSPVTRGHKILLSPLIRYRAKNNIKQIKAQGFLLNSDTNVFFTDTCDNWEIGLYLKHVSKCHIFKIQDQLDILKHLDDITDDNSNVPFGLQVENQLYRYIYGFKWLNKKIDHWTMQVDIKALGCPLVDFSDMSICKEFSIKPPAQGDKVALFFTEPYRNKFQTKDNYEALNVEVVNNLHQLGYKVALKGHPRIGCNVNALNLADFEIPAYVPAEFMDLSNYCFVIGFVSTSLSSSSKQIKAYSILPMCDIIDNEEASYWYDYLNKLSDNRVVFIDSFSKIHSHE